MKEMILVAIGFVAGVLVTAAFGAKVKAFGEKVKDYCVNLLTKTAAKIGNKS